MIRYNLLIFICIYLDPSPRDIRVIRINDTTIQVFWSPIYHPSVERYIIHYNDKSENKPENQWSLFSPSNPGATSAIISGLKADAMYNVRVNAEFSSTNIHDPLHISGTTRREGDLSEIHVADIYRRKKRDREKKKPFSYCVTENAFSLLVPFMSCLFSSFSINQSRGIEIILLERPDKIIS
jgi:hypothetical protein